MSLLGGGGITRRPVQQRPNPHAAAQARYGHALGGGGGSSPAAPMMPPSSASSTQPTYRPSYAPSPAAPGAPPQLPSAPSYSPRRRPRAPAPPQTMDTMRGYGEDLMDPNSDYSLRLQEALTGRIGSDVEAQKRLAAFEASQAGMGTGGSAQLQAILADIGIGGEEALGSAMGDLMTRGPEMGLGALSSVLGAETTTRGQDIGREMGYEGMDVSREMGYAGMDLERALAEYAQEQRNRELGMESYYQGAGLDLARQQMEDEAMWRQFQML